MCQPIRLAERSLALQQQGGLSAHLAARVRFVDDGSDEGDRWGASIWAKDGIHPNDEGYRIWGEHIAKSIVRQALLGPVGAAAES